MWSDNYYYLNIYHDKDLSVSCNTAELKKFLRTFSGLKQGGSFKFNNNTTFPFVDILLLKAKNIDSWSEKETNLEKTNLITIVCSKDPAEDFQKLKDVFIQIATFLNWKLVEEKSEAGIENKVIWEPK